jgi:hypothetical protein
VRITGSTPRDPSCTESLGVHRRPPRSKIPSRRARTDDDQRPLAWVSVYCPEPRRAAPRQDACSHRWSEPRVTRGGPPPSEICCALHGMPLASGRTAKMANRTRGISIGALLALAACSGSSHGSSTSTSEDGGSATSDATNAGDPKSCADWGGTCAGSVRAPAPSCPAGLYPVRGGGGDLCTSSVEVCCVPASAGSRVVKGSNGLLCTSNSFVEFDHGTCAGASCAVGGECRGGGAGGTCDLSRGLPSTKNGSIECAIFGCGSITCSFGCSCKSAETSTCSCP